MPFTLVIDEQTRGGDEARVSKTSVCGSWGPIAGELRYFADKFGNPRASIEGTQMPIRPAAPVSRRSREGELIYDAESVAAPLVLQAARRVSTASSSSARSSRSTSFRRSSRDEARHVLAEALARGEARHPGARQNQAAIESMRETYRRSGGQTPRFEPRRSRGAVRSAARRRQLDDGFPPRAGSTVDADAIVPARSRERYARCRRASTCATARSRFTTTSRNRRTGNVGVARLRLPEKIARTLTEDELPALDRPLRFVVTRGARGAARATRSTSCRTSSTGRSPTRRSRELDRANENRAARAPRARIASAATARRGRGRDSDRRSRQAPGRRRSARAHRAATGACASDRSGARRAIGWSGGEKRGRPGARQAAGGAREGQTTTVALR